jgi:hypothetical protein
VYRAVAGNALRQFKAAYPNGNRAQFETWLAEESLVNPSLAEAGVAMEIMRGEGEDLYGQLSETPAPKRLDFSTGKPVQ